MVNISTLEMVDPDGAFKGAGLLLVDVQERLAPAIAEASRVVPRIQALVQGFRISGLPILATEQYSRGLGRTLPELRRLLRAEEVVEKIHFAAPRESAFRAALQARGISHCFVAGMEAHVCVLQSVLALLAEGISVTAIGDAVASRNDFNRRLALARMERAGATISDSATLSAAMAALSGDAALSP